MLFSAHRQAAFDKARSIFNLLTSPLRMHTILIIGAGFCGAVTAVQLVRQANSTPLRVILLNRSGRMARGLAYGTQSPDHILNVPAGNMTALDGEPDHFLHFAQRVDPACGPASFVSRQIYGDYLESLLEQAEQASGADVSLQRIAGEVSAITLDRNTRQCGVTLADGQEFLVDRVVLAFGHFPSNEPKIDDPAFYRSQRYLRDPWNAHALNAIPPNARTFLLGSGLTAVDVATTLLNRSSTRHISILSRHGLLPKAHRAGPVPQTHIVLPDAFDHAAGNVRQQLRAFRTYVASLANQGADWREALNALRANTPRVWQALPETERRRFLRHVQPYWDNHRHRAAPATHQRFETAISAGAIEVHAGRISAFNEDAGGVQVSFRPRGASTERRILVDYVINCIGPSSDLRTVDNKLVKQLLEQGLIATDRLGLGLQLADDGAVIDSKREASCHIYYVGPLLKARYWEATAVPELRRFAARLAATLLASLNAAPDSATSNA